MRPVFDFARAGTRPIKKHFPRIWNAQGAILRTRVFALLSVLLTAPPLAVSGTDGSAKFSVRDLRPSTEKESKTFSSSMANEAYGISRVGDDVVNSPVALLFRRAFEKLDAPMEPDSVTLHHLVIYRSFKSRQAEVSVDAVSNRVETILVRESSGLPAGMSSAVVSGDVFEAAGSREWLRGRCGASENPSNAVCYVVFIDAELAGKRMTTRTVYPRPNLGDVNTAVPTVTGAAVLFHIARQVE